MDTGISPRVRLAEGLTVRFQIQQGLLLPLHREIAFDAAFGIVATLLSHTYCQHQMQFLYGGEAKAPVGFETLKSALQLVSLLGLIPVSLSSIHRCAGIETAD